MNQMKQAEPVRAYRVWQMVPEEMARLMLDAYKIKIAGINAKEDVDSARPLTLMDYELTCQLPTTKVAGL